MPSTDGSLDIRGRARAFGSRPEISARTVVVTIFGDSVVPAGGEIWLGDLIALARPFGFSDRLTRTSVTRLTAEGWFETERIGRQSRYRLSEFGMGEFAAAERRIYHERRPAWSGDWTLAFVELAVDDREAAQLMGKHLTWHGFGELTPGVYALPGDGGEQAREVGARLGLEAAVPTAEAHFADLDALVDSGAIGARFGLDEAGAGYRLFLERYRPFEALSTGELAPEDAFLARTMVIHDLRRTLLGDPWLPVELLPSDWPGTSAHELAARIYRTVDAVAWAWLDERADLAPVAGRPPRFDD